MGGNQFSIIYGNICAAIGDLSQARLAEVKAVLNMVYLGEILNADPDRPMFFLRRFDDSIKTKSSDTIVSITKASPAVMTTANDTYQTGDIISPFDVVGMTDIEHRMFKLTRTGAKTYNLYTIDGTIINSSSYAAAATGGTIYHRGSLLSAAVKSILSVNWHGYSRPLDPISSAELEDNVSLYEDNTSRPLKFHHYKTFTSTGAEIDIILWFSIPDTNYQMRLWYEFSPAAMSNDTDYPVLPPQFHPAIEAGAITRLGENKTQVEAGVIWPQLYAKHLDALKDYNRNLWKNYEQKRSGLYLI
ncbi:MAG: hypothetical protein ABFD76_15395 [Smithella sp.]